VYKGGYGEYKKGRVAGLPGGPSPLGQAQGTPAPCRTMAERGKEKWKNQQKTEGGGGGGEGIPLGKVKLTKQNEAEGKLETEADRKRVIGKRSTC